MCSQLYKTARKPPLSINSSPLEGTPYMCACDRPSVSFARVTVIVIVCAVVRSALKRMLKNPLLKGEIYQYFLRAQESRQVIKRD